MHRRKGQIQFLTDVLDLTTSKKANDILQQKDIDLISNIQNLVLTDANIQTVTQMAEKVNYNTKSLQAKIKSLTGLTVNQYINEIRLKKAQDLLLNSELSVSEIAYEVCYKDPAYFSRIFKKQVGVSPKEFRE